MPENSTSKYELVQFPKPEGYGGHRRLGRDTNGAARPRCALAGRRIDLNARRVKATAGFPFRRRHAVAEKVYEAVVGSGRLVVKAGLIDMGSWTALRLPAQSVPSFGADDGGLESRVFGRCAAEARGDFVDAGWPS